jgi:hypothetical protein
MGHGWIVLYIEAIRLAKNQTDPLPNFRLKQQKLLVTPAMQARLTGHVWEIEELVGLLG